MPKIRIHIGPDGHPHFYHYDNYHGFDNLVHWDSKGVIEGEFDIFSHWLSKPGLGDEFIVEDISLTIIDTGIYNIFRCMKTCPAAHSLAIFNLLYRQQIRLQHIETKTRINPYLVPGLHRKYHDDFRSKFVIQGDL